MGAKITDEILTRPYKTDVPTFYAHRVPHERVATNLETPSSRLSRDVQMLFYGHEHLRKRLLNLLRRFAGVDGLQVFEESLSLAHARVRTKHRAFCNSVGRFDVANGTTHRRNARDGHGKQHGGKADEQVERLSHGVEFGRKSGGRKSHYCVRAQECHLRSATLVSCEGPPSFPRDLPGGLLIPAKSLAPFGLNTDSLGSGRTGTPVRALRRQHDWSPQELRM